MQVPDNIVWNEENPPTVFECSQHTEHDPACNGTCNIVVLTEIQCELLNEARSWARLGLDPSGLSANSFDSHMTLDCLIDILIGMNIVDRESLNEMFRRRKLETMREMRKEIEPQIEAQRIREKLGLGNKPLFGPNGQKLN